MKIKTWQIALVLLLSLCLPPLLIRAQRTANIQSCAPARTPFEYWQRIRSIPVRFTKVQGNTVYWKFEDPTGVHLGSFQLEKHTFYFDEKFEKKDRLYFEFNLTKTEWGINFDSECFSVLSATKLP